MPPQRLNVARVIIGRAFFPAPVDDALPLEGQRAEGRVVTFAALPLLIVISSGPGAASDREAGVFVEGLPHECGRPPTPRGVAALSATFGDGRNA